jgi:signal transduction histidine kinase
VPLDAAGYARWGELLRAGQPVVGDIGDFPESERPLLELQEIKSLLVQPIFEDKRWWGFMGFDACEALQSWERVEVDTLRIAALVLGATMHRQTRDTQLRETQKLEALGRMASSVAHDFNNVLMVVGGAMELLKCDLEASGARQLANGAHCAMVDQALERAGTLTRRLLEFSRRQSGVPQVVSPLDLLRREFRRQRVQLHRLVVQHRQLRPRPRPKSWRFLLQCRGPELRLRAVIGSLVGDHRFKRVVWTVHECTWLSSIPIAARSCRIAACWRDLSVPTGISSTPAACSCVSP